MIIAHIMGGLGNQMFQYAAGLRLAIRLNTTLKLDVSWFAQQGKRDYGLSHFDFCPSFVTSVESYLFTGDSRGGFTEALHRLRQRHRLMRGLMRRCLRLWNPAPRVYEEPCLDYDPGFLSLPNNIYLLGYWQSEKYFSSIADVVRRRFTFRESMSAQVERWAREIQGCESVGVHVRRGDYVQDPYTKRFFGVLPLEYYRRAHDMILENVQQPRFFVFSDEPDWVASHFEFPSPFAVVTGKEAHAGQDDLRLMSLCRHHVIANSSFSWWGAWLSQNDHKIVIAPKRWFIAEPVNQGDRLPPEWWSLDEGEL